MKNSFYDIFDEIENNEELLNFRFDTEGILFWPFVRYKIFNEILSERFGLMQAHASKEKLTFFDVLNYSIKTLKNNPFRSSNKDIIIFTTTAGDTLKINGKYFNRIHDYFAEQFPNDTLLIEDSFRRKYKEPRYFKNVSYHDYIKVATVLKSKINGKISQRNQKEIKHFISFLKSQMINYSFSNEFYNKIENILIKLSKRLGYYEFFYKKLFSKLNPKIIFLNCASYGSESYILKWAKDMKVKTGEFQHGIITKIHPAYNYGKVILNNKEYHRFLPDYLLTFGQFWNENMRTPSKKFETGYPHFTESVKKYRTVKKRIKEDKIILVISQGTVTKKLVNLTENLSKMLENKKNYKIIFRLHPGEVPFKERYKKLSAFKNVIINSVGDIYKLLDESTFVVGVNSTTIFEAKGFNKPVFIYDLPEARLYIPEKMGIYFRNEKELYDLVTSWDKKSNSEDFSYYFNPNWKENYRNFLKRVFDKI